MYCISCTLLTMPPTIEEQYSRKLAELKNRLVEVRDATENCKDPVSQAYYSEEILSFETSIASIVEKHQTNPPMSEMTPDTIATVKTLKDDFESLLPSMGKFLEAKEGTTFVVKLELVPGGLKVPGSLKHIRLSVAIAQCWETFDKLSELANPNDASVPA